jgi:hypothetical protein
MLSTDEGYLGYGEAILKEPKYSFMPKVMEA